MPLRRVTLPAAALCLSLMLAGCSVDSDDGNNLEDTAANIANLMPIPETPSTLDRGGLLAAIGEATNAYAAGLDDSEAQRALAGRRFAFRMPFGCAGDGAPSDGPLRLSVREDGKSYEARVTYSIKVDDIALVAPEAEDADGKPMVETVEGFWIEQPWLLAERCPVPLSQTIAASEDDEKSESDKSAAKPLALEHSVGLASFVTPSDSRVGTRAGRDYVKVVTLKDGETPPPGMFLLIEGRLRAWPDGKAIHCRPAPSGNRPICIAGVSIDRVAFERTDNRTLVAEWAN